MHNVIREWGHEACQAAGFWAKCEVVVPHWAKERRRGDTVTFEEAHLDIVALDASDGTELYIDGTCRCPVAQKYIDAGSANSDGKSTEMASADKQARYRASDSRRVITAAAELGGVRGAGRHAET